jgi:hypothetical protein
METETANENAAKENEAKKSVLTEEDMEYSKWLSS